MPITLLRLPLPRFSDLPTALINRLLNKCWAINQMHNFFFYHAFRFLWSVLSWSSTMQVKEISDRWCSQLRNGALEIKLPNKNGYLTSTKKQSDANNIHMDMNKIMLCLIIPCLITTMPSICEIKRIHSKDQTINLYLFCNNSLKYLAHRIHQPIPKVRILNFHEFLNQSDWFWRKTITKQIHEHCDL